MDYCAVLIVRLIWVQSGRRSGGEVAVSAEVWVGADVRGANILVRVMTRFRVRDRVRVEGHDEEFAVAYVNEADAWADLGCLSRVGFLARVPLAKIRFANKDEDTDKPAEGAA
jgi:hypothetical protein